MRSFGVKVSVIEPGYFRTMITNVDNLEKNFRSSWEKLPQEIKESYGEGYLRQCKYLPQMLSDSLLTHKAHPQGHEGPVGIPLPQTPRGATWLCSTSVSQQHFLPLQLWPCSR